MTRKESYNRIDAIIAKYEIDDEYVTITNSKDYDALRIARKALEQESSNDMVSRGVFEQVMWERNVAIEQLKELGYGFGERLRTDSDIISRKTVKSEYKRQLESDLKDDTRGIDFSEFADCTAFNKFIDDIPSVEPQESMREFTEEEAKAYSKALDKMYKPTGFNVFNELCEDAISRQAVLELVADYDLSMGQVVKGIHALPPVTPHLNNVLDKIKGYVDHIGNTGMGKKKSLEFIDKFIEELQSESEVEE